MRRSMSKPLPLKAATVGLAEKPAGEKLELAAIGGGVLCPEVTVRLQEEVVI